MPFLARRCRRRYATARRSPAAHASHLGTLSRGQRERCRFGALSDSRSTFATSVLALVATSAATQEHANELRRRNDLADLLTGRDQVIEVALTQGRGIAHDDQEPPRA
jgi:hypothetical protein